VGGRSGGGDRLVPRDMRCIFDPLIVIVVYITCTFVVATRNRLVATGGLCRRGSRSGRAPGVAVLARDRARARASPAPGQSRPRPPGLGLGRGAGRATEGLREASHLQPNQTTKAVTARSTRP